MSYGGIEAGGTKWVCATVAEDGRLLARATIPTTEPRETLAAAQAFFAAEGIPKAIGIGAFGPVDLNRESPTYGHITTTPKPGWANTDVVRPFQDGLGIPVAVDTDVNAAAVGEWRWGAGAGLDTFTYITVGTGIGAGSVVNGRPVHGLLHPEFGHMRIPHDRAQDPFDGACPYHGDCLEGLASGESMRRRWGTAAERLSSEHEGWQLEAEYLASALMNLVCVLSPQRIILGGGLTKGPALLPRVRERLHELLAGYLDVAALTDLQALRDYVVPPLLGDDAGVLGAVELGRQHLVARIDDSTDGMPTASTVLSVARRDGD